MSKYDNLRQIIQHEYETNITNLTILSKKYNIPYDTIQTWSKKFSWKKQPLIRETTKYNSDIYDKAKEMYQNSAYNLKQIAEKLDISKSTVQTWSKKFNWIKSDEYKNEYKKSLIRETIKESDGDVIEIKKLFETTDLSIPEIAKQVNSTPDKVRNRIKKFKFIRSKELQKQCNSRLGKLRQNSLTEEKQQIRNNKIKTWNLDHIGQIHNTRKVRNRYSKSQIEDTLYRYLVNEFGIENVERQYILDNMSFDFKLTRLDKEGNTFDQLIELHGAFYHNFRPFINCEEHIQEYNNLISKGGMYKVIAHKWKDIDTNKYLYCKDHNINYTAIYFDTEPKPFFTTQELINSYTNIKNQKFKFTNISIHNEIVDNFCYKDIYKSNFYKFKDMSIIYPYLVNRIKYAYDYGKGVHNISLLKLLKDFNKSGSILSSYTMHPINNIRTFIDKYNCKFIADPFAGWGHRLIGAMSLNCDYICVDINTSQCKNLNSIQQFISSIDTALSSNQYIINADSSCVDISNYEFDSIFTCPPYYNKEIYTDKGIENLSYIEYKSAIKNIFDKWITPKVKVVGIQYTEEYEDVIDNLGYKYEKIILNQGIHHLTKTSKKYNECIYILNI